jgi:hypothetical protein
MSIVEVMLNAGTAAHHQLPHNTHSRPRLATTSLSAIPVTIKRCCLMPPLNTLLTFATHCRRRPCRRRHHCHRRLRLIVVLSASSSLSPCLLSLFLTMSPLPQQTREQEGTVGQ